MVTPRFLTLSVASREMSSICREADGKYFGILLLLNKIINFNPSLEFFKAVLKSVNQIR